LLILTLFSDATTGGTTTVLLASEKIDFKAFTLIKS